MKNFKTYSYILFAGLLGLASCKPDISKTTPTAGSADFTRYISVGNSLTAGYADGGLYREGQLNSYPSIIAKQMATVGGGTFTQPLFTEAQANGSGYLKLNGFDPATGSPITANVTTNLAITGVTNVPTSATTSLSVTTYTKYTGDFNNYGVPGIKLLQATTASYGNFNGYFDRMLTTSIPNNNTAYIDFVTAKPFTFFTDWLGNNDVLGYATSGGAGDVLTDKATFDALYQSTIAKLTATGAKGAVATIPDVTTIPYFNTVTYAAVLAGVQKAVPTASALVISAQTTTPATAAVPATTTYAPRAGTTADLIVLTFPTSLIGSPTAGTGNGPYGLSGTNPIESKYVLDVNEIAYAKDYVAAFNTSIKAVASAKGLALFDANAFLTNVKANGLLINGVSLSSNYISGGIFSLDGVHLTPRGYSIVANEFIKAINSKYGSTIPLADVSAYNGVKFP